MKSYSCKKCDFETKKKSNYLSHLKTAKHLGIKNDQIRIRSYTCADCNYSTNCSSNLSKHLKTKKHLDGVEKRTCHVCDKICGSKTQLTSHMMLHRTRKTYLELLKYYSEIPGSENKIEKMKTYYTQNKSKKGDSLRIRKGLSDEEVTQIKDKLTKKLNKETDFIKSEKLKETLQDYAKIYF